MQSVAKEWDIVLQGMQSLQTIEKCAINCKVWKQLKRVQTIEQCETNWNEWKQIFKVCKQF